MEALPSVDVIVATLGRSTELGALLASLARQSPRPRRVIIVDQNSDDRLVEVIAEARAELDIAHLRSSVGLSRSRNAGLAQVGADLVSFPDDDCTYPDGLLEHVAQRFVADQGLGALTGRTVDPSGSASTRWPAKGGPITLATVWHGGNSASTFVRRGVLETAGPFDERLGLGAGTQWSSGEDVDLLIRILRTKARVEYDPTLVVSHPLRAFTPDELMAIGARDGASVGFLLRKHRYGVGTVGRMFLRPALGIPIALARGDLTGARFRLATFGGRFRGYRAGR